MRYEKLQSQFWSEPEFEDWTPAARLLYLWALGNPFGNGITGISKASPKQIALQTGIAPEAQDEAFAEIGHRIKRYDGNWIWLKARFRYACESSNHYQAAVNSIRNASIPNELRRDFVAMHDGDPRFNRFKDKPIGRPPSDKAPIKGLSRTCKGLGTSSSSSSSSATASDSQSNTDSSEPSEAEASEPVAFSFAQEQIVGQGEGPWHVTADLHKTLLEAYPAVNLEAEYRQIVAWLIANPDRRKTRRGMPRFINSWLSRAQEKPRDQRQRTSDQRRPGPAYFPGQGTDADDYRRIDEAARARAIVTGRSEGPPQNDAQGESRGPGA